MNERRIVQGETVEIQLDSIDRVLRRLIRRSVKTAVAVLPKLPLMFAVDKVKGDDGVLGQFLFPLSGTITTAFLHVEVIEGKTKPVLHITLHYPGGSRTAEFEYRVGLNKLQQELSVFAGSRLVISTTEAESVKGLSFGLVFEVAKDATALEQIVLAAVEEDANAREIEG